MNAIAHHLGTIPAPSQIFVGIKRCLPHTSNNAGSEQLITIISDPFLDFLQRPMVSTIVYLIFLSDPVM